MEYTVQPVLPALAVGAILAILLGLSIWHILRRTISFPLRIFRILRIAAIFVLVFLINLRIMVPSYDMNIRMKNVDVLFVLDDTISMWAEDSQRSDTRMEDAVADCIHIMQQLQGSNFGLVRFDNKAQILAPFTQDMDNVADAMRIISQPDTEYASGTSMNTAYQDMEDLLISSDKKTDRKTFVFFLSDGEVTNGEAVRSFEDLSDYIDGGAVLGYGTPEGGQMEDRYGSAIIDESTYENAISRIDEDNLGKIAADLRVEYIHMTQESDVDHVIRQIQERSVDINGTRRGVVYNDTYYYYALPLAVLFALELGLLVRKGRL